MFPLVTAPRRRVTNEMKWEQIGTPAKDKNAEHGDYKHIDPMAVDHSPLPRDDTVSFFCLETFVVRIGYGDRKGYGDIHTYKKNQCSFQ